MLTSDAIKCFESVEGVAKALGITVSAVYQWKELVPPLRAAQLAALSEGKLEFDPNMYADWNKRKSA